MATLLLIIIYLAFIGLGIPDSLFGTAWPAIYTEFNLPISYGSAITVLCSLCTTFSSLFSVRLIRRFGTNKVTAFCTALTATALFGYSFADSFGMLCLLAIPLGLGGGAIDNALNAYVSLHYSATQMSFLHSCYGVGVTISPYILSLVISGENGWRGGYRIAFFIQLAISLTVILTLPVWRKAHGKTRTSEERKPKVLTFKELIQLPGIKAVWCIFLCSCAIEFICGSWGSTFLVEYKGLPIDKAAGMVVFYYAGITLGRFFSGLLATKWSCWRIVKIGEYVIAAALLILLLPLPTYFSAVGLFLVGLGNGPIYPNFSYLTPSNFGEENAEAVMGTEQVFAYIGATGVPAICGVLAQAFGLWLFPIFLLIFFVPLVVGTFSLDKIKNK
ncbi:MAG: MFS transporter [Lachnospiraceae bacterium]|nr:MFS transporter [Lachnospiraceae bacterium]